MRQLRSFRFAFLSAALLLAACGDDADTGTESGSDTSGTADTGGTDGSTDGSAVAFVAPKTPAIQPVPTPVCQVDLDCGGGDFCFVKHCASQCSDERPCEDGSDCDARGRCGGGLKAIDDTDRSASFRIVEPPSRRITLARNATEVRVALTLTSCYYTDTEFNGACYPTRDCSNADGGGISYFDGFYGEYTTCYLNYCFEFGREPAGDVCLVKSGYECTADADCASGFCVFNFFGRDYCF